jgi:peptide/nickel transport system permease protein
MTPDRQSKEESQRLADIATEYSSGEESFVERAEQLRVGDMTYHGSTRTDIVDAQGLTDSLGHFQDVVSVVPSDDAIVPQWRQMLRIFFANKLAIASLAFLLFVTLGCFLGKYIYHTNQTDLIQLLGSAQNSPPSIHHLLGTDKTGWDILGRIMYSGEYSLTLGFLAGFITIVIGTLYGMISGYFGGIIDSMMMRLLDAFLSIPYLFMLISLVFIFGRSTTFLILIIGLTGWWGNARIIRSDALLIRDLEYSQAASSMGASKLYIIRKHVFRNSMGNIVTVGTFSVADAILFLSALGFIGFGIQPPQDDWGTMLNGGVAQLLDGFWWEVFPVTIVFILVIVCINYIGDALRDVFEVRYRGR